MSKKTQRLRDNFIKSLRLLGLWFIIFLIAVAIFGGVLYAGIVRVPSTATYLANFNNLETIQNWNDFKKAEPQLDPITLESPFFYSGVWVNVSAMSWEEEVLQPKTVISFHVKISTDLQTTYSLKLQSLLLLLLDQNERIRGKLYTQQSSPDLFISAQNQTEYAFWFNVPNDMQNQQISIVVELFGIVDYSTSINYQNLNANANDKIYGTIPPYENPPLSGDYFRLRSYDRTYAHNPVVYSYFSLAVYSLTLAGLFSTLVAIPIWLKEKSKSWWERNRIRVVFGVMFLVTYIVILFLVGLFVF
jgi:hypothetical protein